MLQLKLYESLPKPLQYIYVTFLKLFFVFLLLTSSFCFLFVPHSLSFVLLSLTFVPLSLSFVPLSLSFVLLSLSFVSFSVSPFLLFCPPFLFFFRQPLFLGPYQLQKYLQKLFLVTLKLQYFLLFCNSKNKILFQMTGAVRQQPVPPARRKSSSNNKVAAIVRPNVPPPAPPSQNAESSAAPDKSVQQQPGQSGPSDANPSIQCQSISDSDQPVLPFPNLDRSTAMASPSDRLAAHLKHPDRPMLSTSYADRRPDLPSRQLDRPSLTSGQAADRPAQGRPRPPPFPPARFRPVPQPPPLPSQQATRPLPAVPYGQPVRPAPVPPTSGPPPPQTTSRPPPLLQTPSRPPPLPKKPPPPLLSSSFPRIVSETETIISDNNSNFSVTEDNNPPQNISNSPYKPLWPGLPPTPLFGGSADDDVIMSADGVGAILATEELAKCTLLNTGKNSPFWTDFKLLNLHCHIAVW